MPDLYVTPLGLLAVLAAAIGLTVICRAQISRARNRRMRPIALKVVLLLNVAAFLLVALADLARSLPTLAIGGALFAGFIWFQDQILSAIAGPTASLPHDIRKH